MRTLTLVLLMVLCAPAIPVRNAVAQEQQSALAELQRLDRALAKICEARKDRLDDRERDMWKRRRELVDSLDERQRDALKRTSPLNENCLQLIARLAEPRRPSYSPPIQGSQSGYSSRRHGYPYGGGGSPRARMAPPSAETPMAPQAAPQAPEARTGPPSSPQATIDSPTAPQPRIAPRASPQARIGPQPAPPPTSAPGPVSGDVPLKDLFPWPPPTPSTRRAFSPDVNPDSAPAKIVGDVASRLERILLNADYDSFGYYRVPGGFALVTRIESLDGATGEPLAGAARWGTRATYAGLSLSSIFAITRSAGYYRVFVFLLTNDPPMTQQTDPGKTLKIAEAWATEGRPSLPADVKSLPVGPNHILVVMVYEFEKFEGGETNHFQPSRWPLDQHLSSLGAELKPPQ
ncbi:MAG: hypothetical protein WAJ91_11475 [Rhodoplanes sp.]